MVASLEGLIDEQFEALLETMCQRKDVDGVQRLYTFNLNTPVKKLSSHLCTRHWKHGIFKWNGYSDGTHGRV
jgi:hypothetical protein